MTRLTNEQLQSIKDGCDGVTPGPYRTDAYSTDVWAPSAKGGDTKLLDIRGWGYLTGKGHGALGLSEDAAIAIQKANAAHIARLDPETVRAIVTELQERRAQVDKLTHENEVLVDSVENGVIIQNWFDLIEELGVPRGGSLWDTVLRLHHEKQTGRDALVEQCAKVAEDEAARWGEVIGSSAMNAAAAIRALASPAPVDPLAPEMRDPISEVCSHPWAYQDQNGIPFCAACGEDWLNVLHPLIGEKGCICREEHRRGYCTEPGCPHAFDRATPPAAIRALATQAPAVTLTREQIEAALNNLIGVFPHTPSIITASGRSEIACAIIAAQRDTASRET